VLKHILPAESVYSPDWILLTGEPVLLLRRNPLLIIGPRVRSPHFFVALLLFTAAFAPAQVAPTAGTFSVRGTVVNSVSGAPVGRAFVELNAQYAMLTDGSGQFSFDHVPAGLYMVCVQKPGYLTIGIPQGGGHRFRWFGGQELHSRSMRVNGDTDNLRFAMTPAGSISGQVTVSGADPSDGIVVSLYARQFQDGRPLWVPAGHATTRSDGTFRFGDLAPGSYTVNTQANLETQAGFEENSNRPVWGYPPVYYPGVTDPNSAGIMTLAAGQQAEADFSVKLQQFFPVTIAVRGSQQGTPGEFNVLDAGGRPTGFPARYSLAEQLVHANVPNGSWILNARGFGQTMTWGRAAFQVAGAPVSLAIALEQIPRIPVEIHRDFTSSNAPAPTTNAGLSLRLISADPFNATGGAGFLTTRPPAEGGGWQINVTEPGRYWIDATPQAPAYISSITSSGTDLMSNPLLVATGGSSAHIDVTLRDDSGTISGQMSTGSTASSGTSQPQEAVQLCAIPLFPTVAHVPVTMPASDGSFRFAGLAPGSYRVASCSAPQEIDFHSADGLSAWTGKGQVATVSAGSAAQVTLSESGGETAQ
jgi:hypothetical protein